MFPSPVTMTMFPALASILPKNVCQFYAFRLCELCFLSHLPHIRCVPPCRCNCLGDLSSLYTSPNISRCWNCYLVHTYILLFPTSDSEIKFYKVLKPQRIPQIRIYYLWFHPSPLQCWSWFSIWSGNAESDGSNSRCTGNDVVVKEIEQRVLVDVVKERRLMPNQSINKWL